MQINHFTLSAQLTFVATILLGIFVLLGQRWKIKHYLIFSLYCFAIGWWCFFVAFFKADFRDPTLFYGRWLHCFAILIPVLFFNFIESFLEKKYWFKNYVLATAAVLLFLNFFSKLFISGITNKAEYSFPQPGPFYVLFVAFFAFLTTWGILELFFEYRKSGGVRRNQLKYLLLFSILGYIGGTKNFIILFNIHLFPIYPYGTYAIPLYVIGVFYAIVRYRLMDIRVAITSAGICFIVYAISLGVPFYLMAKGYHWIALATMAGLASIAPYIYVHLRKQAEDRIFEEQKQYQEVLLKASQGLTKLKKVEEISRFVVNVILKAIRIKSAGFYLFDGLKFVLKDHEGDVARYALDLQGESPVVEHLRVRGAVFLDELKQDNPNDARALEEVRAFFKAHPANVAVPVMRDGKMFGLLFLGDKANNTPYSDRDLTVFNVIADQTALAMENAAHLEMTRKDFLEQMHDRRLKDMGLLGSTISHQMCNRLQKITLGLEYAQSVLNEKATANDTKETITEKLKECLNDFEMMKREALSAAAISDALKTFSKSGNEPSAVPLKRVVRMAKDLVDAKHKDFHYDFAEEYPDNLALWVNISAMQDVLFNAFDNSLDAIKIKQKSVNCPPGYAPLISVEAHANGTLAAIEITDNGVGFRPENLEKVFIPFFTTKGTMEGTGLGLHAMRELVRRNNGDIAISSEFFQWARVTINLPLATEERIITTKPAAP